MATTWLDGVTRQSWDTDGGTFTGGPAKGILHTTESIGFPGYSLGKTAPHFTVKAEVATKKLTIRQHIPVNMAARALVNKSGGVQTNRDSAIQIELVGSCNPEWRLTKAAYYYWPTADPWALVALANLMRKLETACGIARKAVLFKAYPSSYGLDNRVRLSFSQWDSYSGWMGHQHVPENTHGDPGNLNIGALMAAVTIPPASNVPVVKPPVTVRAPKFPLPSGHSYGRKGYATYIHSGHSGATDRANIRVWQTQMRKRGWTIDVDGFFGPQSHTVATQFQRNKKLTANGLVGPITWAASWALQVSS